MQCGIPSPTPPSQQQHHASSFRPIKVNVRLCGSMSREDMSLRTGAFCSLRALAAETRVGLSASCLAATNGPASELPTLPTTSPCDTLLSSVMMHNANKNSMRPVLQEKQPLAPLFEPPPWAVPGCGETRLEPVCEGLGRQTAVDLTRKACFRIGRSPNSDVQLMHGTSSRRHAMLFHHSNGSCYIVDCGSAHGTFVNGKLLPSTSNGGVVVPHKVRRGALIRFGGPGAPCFILKSFHFKLNDVAEPPPSKPDMGELVRRNTRINALGKTATESIRNNVSATIFNALIVSRKRSFDSLSTGFTFDDEEPCKRMRCSSPPLSPEQPIRLVSPDLPSILKSKPRRVTFSLDPPQAFYAALVSPGEVSAEEDN